VTLASDESTPDVAFAGWATFATTVCTGASVDVGAEEQAVARDAVATKETGRRRSRAFIESKGLSVDEHC